MDSIKKLQDLFSKFPTVGHRTAGRFVFYLINRPTQEVDELIAAIQELKKSIQFCRFCFKPFETATQESLCEICSNPSRNNQLLCVIEKENDLLTIEASRRYNGLYFVLGGSVLTFRKQNAENMRLSQLQERILTPQNFGIKTAVFSEIIIATNPTPEGKATSTLIQRQLKQLPQTSSMKITHLAKGLPVGGELEYADDETLESAFEGRK